MGRNPWGRKVKPSPPDGSQRRHSTSDAKICLLARRMPRNMHVHGNLEDGREESNSGNGRPRQAPRLEEPNVPMKMMLEMFSQMQRMHSETLHALKEVQQGKRESLSKRIKDLPYNGRKWQATGELDMAVQLAEFISDVERHAKRADKHGEVLKAVEESIGRIPKRAWYDATRCSSSLGTLKIKC